MSRSLKHTLYNKFHRHNILRTHTLPILQKMWNLLSKKKKKKMWLSHVTAVIYPPKSPYIYFSPIRDHYAKNEILKEIDHKY